MARGSSVLENPVTGERIEFLRTSADTGGELLELEDTWTRRGHRTREHSHPGMEERFEVLSGTAAFRIAGEERTAGPGEIVVVPAGTAHLAWNPTDEPVRLRVEFRPALRWQAFVEEIFALAAAGRVDERGVPEPAELARLLREYPDELAPA